MFDKIRLAFIFNLMACMTTTVALADIIHLTSGQVIEGTVVERTEDEIKVDTGIGVLVTYYLDEVREISSVTANPSSMPEIGAGDPQNILPLTGEPEGAETSPSPSADTAATISAAPASPPPAPTDLDAGSREEHFLLQQYRKNMDEKAQTEGASTPPSEPLNREEYLEKQLGEKQALFKEEISKSVRLADQKLTQGVSALLHDNPQLKETLKTKSLPPYFPILLIGIIIGFYVLVCYPCMMIAQKLGLAGWMAWVPVVQIFLLFQMAGRPWWWVLLLLIPVINLLIPIILWMDIAKRFSKSIVLGILMIVPVLNLIIPWYIAFSSVAEE